MLTAGRGADAGHRGRLRADSIYIYFPDLDPKVPIGPAADKWDRHRFESKLVNPANRRRHTTIIVGTGLAGGSAASALGELDNCC